MLTREQLEQRYVLACQSQPKGRCACISTASRLRSARMATGNLSLLSTEPLRLELPDADVRLWPQALAPDEADALFAALRGGIQWQRRTS